MTNTIHFYRVYTNNFGSPDKFVQLIQLFRLNKDTVRIKADNGKISNVPANRFHVDKSTDALIYSPRPNHTGYILEEYTPDTTQNQYQCPLCKHFNKGTCANDPSTGFCNYQNFATRK